MKEKCNRWDDHIWAHVTSLNSWECLSCGMKTDDTSSEHFETGMAVNDDLERIPFVKLDRFCSVHDDGSIYVPAEISTYWQLVYAGVIQPEYSNFILDYVKI